MVSKIEIGLASILISSIAIADPSAADRETARAYMAEGRAKRAASDLKGALRAFEAADAIVHVPTTALEVAKTEAQMGLLVEARDEALHVVRTPVTPGEAPQFAEARVSAQVLADDLEQRIPSIRVVLKNGDGATISIDDVALPAIAIGLQRKLDPGAHVIVAKLGANEKRINVQVLEREAKEIPIDLAEHSSVVVEQAPSAASQDLSESHKPPWVIVGIVGLVAGAAGLAIGSVTGVMSISQTNTIKNQCNGASCPPTLAGGGDTKAAIADANTLALASDIAFIVGGVLAATGATFVVLGATKKSDAHMSVGLGPGSLFVAGSF